MLLGGVLDVLREAIVFCINSSGIFSLKSAFKLVHKGYLVPVGITKTAFKYVLSGLLDDFLEDTRQKSTQKDLVFPVVCNLNLSKKCSFRMFCHFLHLKNTEKNIFFLEIKNNEVFMFIVSQLSVD